MLLIPQLLLQAEVIKIVYVQFNYNNNKNNNNNNININKNGYAKKQNETPSKCVETPYCGSEDERIGKVVSFLGDSMSSKLEGWPMSSSGEASLKQEVMLTNNSSAVRRRGFLGGSGCMAPENVEI